MRPDASRLLKAFAAAVAFALVDERHVQLRRAFAGEDGHPRGRATRRRRVKIREPHPALRKLLQVRRADKGALRRRHRIVHLHRRAAPAVALAEDEDEVWRLRGCRVNRRSQQRGNGKAEEPKQASHLRLQRYTFTGPAGHLVVGDLADFLHRGRHLGHPYHYGVRRHRLGLADDLQAGACDKHQCLSRRVR